MQMYLLKVAAGGDTYKFYLYVKCLENSKEILNNIVNEILESS